MLQPGHVINETYRVERLLGSGGMADVYEVVHTRLPRRFALKVMRLESNQRQAFLRRFKQEGEILASLRHPHIVDVVDRNQCPDGSPYLVMELLEGEDLSTYLARTGVLSCPVALRICSQIGEALEAAHKVGVVHRDLKPSNVFLSRQGPVLNFVKVLDFGIAKIAKPDPLLLTSPAALMGTPAYMAPEQALGLVAEIDARTDQFALGTVLYEMLTGRAAFHQEGDVVYAILRRVVNEQPEPLKDPQLNQAIMRALSKKPEQRFPSMREFLAAVGATNHTVYCVPTSIVEAPGTLSSQIVERPASASGPRKRVITIAGFGLVLCVAVASLVYKAVLWQPPHAGVVNPALDSRTAPASELAAGVASRCAPPPAAEPPDPDTLFSAFPSALFSASGAVVQPRPTLLCSPETQSLPVATDEKRRAVVKPAAVVNRAMPRPGGHRFLVSAAGQIYAEQLILACAREYLGPLSLREGLVIKLKGRGTFAPIIAPNAVYESGFNACLRSALSQLDPARIPEEVTVKVIR